MSAAAASLPCPICVNCGVFDSVQSLRDRLIYVSTNNILCPVCQEEVSGLDKLTIHLFSHVKILGTKDSEKKKDLTSKPNLATPTTASLPTKSSKSNVAKNKSSSTTAAAPIKYVKIYPKLPTISLNTVPVIDITRGSSEEYAQPVSVAIVKAETSNSQTNTICNVCGLQFVDANILKMHKCLIHNIDETCSDNFTRYQCHLCPKNFKMRGSLMVHLRVAHFGFLSGNCNSTDKNKDKSAETSEDKFTNLERNDNKQWQCDVCRKCFTTKYFLKKHKRLHTGETPYACTQCNKTFTFQQSYHKHLLYHNDEKPHTCNYCGRAFKELSTLHNHQRIHTGEKPFSCETCGKCFRQRVSYLVHRRIHTGVMPYKCTACEKSFRYKVSQRTHKCQSKPPGTVVRQSGNLVEKLKKKHGNAEISNNEVHEQLNKENNYPEISEANAKLVLTGAKLSLEDMESENFTLLEEHFEYSSNKDLATNTPCSSQPVMEPKNFGTLETNLDQLIDSIPTIDKNVPSPSEILKNLCLSKEEEYPDILQDSANEKTYDLFEVLM
ncbi:zinc finger protein 2 [Ostrinia furnacalis]|uniref:zinc finger protein 2 n=1 Tax=Ostrinia furnacalis TaxID=93504 RepID=UPI00103D271E|nr:zinc finger protein 2 [Ostrinia furnacalis]